ncbi:fibronectin type III domain-containing protein, partial [Winogradskyella rapida]
MKHIYLFFIALMLTSLGFGQTTIYTQDFETNLNGYSHTPSQTPASDSGDQYFHRAEPSDGDIYESGGPYTNVNGDWLFVGSNPKTFNSGNSGILSFGSIDVSGFSDLVFSADFGGVPNDWDASDEVSVEYSWDNSTWSVLYSFSSPVTNDPLELENNATGGVNTTNGAVLTYALQTITSNNFSGTGTTLYLRIVCNSDANYEAFGVDNIILEGTASPTCTAPITQASAYNTTALGTTSATLNWTVGTGDEVLVVVKEGSAVDTDPTNGTDYTGSTVFGSGDELELGTGNYAVYADLTTNSVDITGLSEATTYHVAVYEYNTTDTCYLTPALTGSFTTEIACPVITGLTIDSFTDTTANINWTPGDTETDWEVVIQDAGTGTPSGSGTATTTNNPYLASGLIQNTAYEVYVRANCVSDGFSTWAGPINFTTEISCPEITGLTIDSFTDTTANISWTPGDTETDWEVVIQNAGTGTPSGSGTATTTNNPYLASGLTQNKAYEVYVRANCVSDGFSTWVGPINFTTEISCPEITGLTIDSFTDTTANISWTPGDTETDWEVVIQNAGTGTPSGSGTATTTNNPYLASGLTQNTAYEVYVRANCVSDGFSTWADPTTFTTEISCPEITGLTIDSFTDTTANISWTPGDTETDWEVVIQNAGTGTPSGSGTAT